MRFPMRHRHRDLDKRVERARREAEVSRKRLHQVREEVIAPLTQRAQENQFAELIWVSLIKGRGE